MDRTEAGGKDEKMYEAIVEAVRELHDRELVRIDTSGPRITVTVDIYSTEGGMKNHQERAVYAVQLEPEVDLLDDDEPEIGEDHLNWSYIGPVEDLPEDDDGERSSGDDAPE